MRLCVVIPAYNAEDTVGDVVTGSKKYLQDVIVIDDGSIDNTAVAAEAAGAVVIRQSENLGKGDALKIGFRYAIEKNYDAVITIDADGQHYPDEMPKFIDKYKEGGQQIIVGSRMHAKSYMPKYRYRCNIVGVILISVAARQYIADTQSGYRLYDVNILKDINIQFPRFQTETEILIKAGKKGYKITSVPIKAIYNDRTETKSHFKRVADTYNISILVLKSCLWSKKTLRGF